ncbi:MAG: hypothetical protein JJ934_06595 [Pseudomonadales bacterium]|nr:hypothetical protein [Pseudomonadales bacterium]MBO6594736.1 hypothetical protein [Pseudomonadales bacterium]MBO6656541.1 hypothetical protein [Pseudomonadales bacterium]MBO6701242.1 hypothetical protein [Pseudomonadales bacterium]MBO6821704.1 hypothetical protein [Pseudomonadales bacterium]
MDIPVVSLRSLKNKETAALQTLSDAAHEWGFFRLVEHDLEQVEINRFLDVTRAFFAQPEENKKALSRTEENPWGYYDRELTKNRQDWKEIFDLGLTDTPWPESGDFKSCMLTWHEQCESISLDLIRSICLVLHQDADYLTSAFTPTNTSFLRLNHYPICPNPADSAENFPEAGQLGIHHHTDAGAVTVLLQDGVSGLQVRHRSQWHTIEADRETLIVNIGDMVQVWSNDRFVAPLHRVLANSDTERFSAAFFMNPKFETNCRPLLEEAPRYDTVNWGEFRAARAAGDYADIGEEIQISNFRI